MVTLFQENVLRLLMNSLNCIFALKKEKKIQKSQSKNRIKIFFLAELLGRLHFPEGIHKKLAGDGSHYFTFKI